MSWTVAASDSNPDHNISKTCGVCAGRTAKKDGGVKILVCAAAPWKAGDEPQCEAGADPGNSGGGGDKKKDKNKSKDKVAQQDSYGMDKERDKTRQQEDKVPLRRLNQLS